MRFKILLLSLTILVCVAAKQNKLKAQCDKREYVVGLVYKPNHKKTPISVECERLKTPCKIKCLWGIECSKSRVWGRSGRRTFISGVMLHRTMRNGLSRQRCCSTTGYDMINCKTTTRLVNIRKGEFHLKRLKSKKKLVIRDVKIENHRIRTSLVYIKAEVCEKKKRASCSAAAAAGGGAGGASVGGTDSGSIARNAVSPPTVASANITGSAATCPTCTCPSTNVQGSATTSCPDCSATTCPDCSAITCPDCSAITCPDCSTKTCADCSAATCPDCSVITCPDCGATTCPACNCPSTSEPGGDSDVTCEDGLTVGLEPPVCDCMKHFNVKDCQYISKGDYELIEDGGSYECTCAIGHAADTGDGTEISLSCIDSEWSAGASCVPVCKAFTQPENVKDCKYTGERTDGLIDDGGTYTCTCVDGYATDAGDKITSTCTKSEWSNIETCVPKVCQCAKPDNAKDCQYTDQDESGLIKEGGSYECSCSDGHAPDTGSGTTITSTCTDNKWSAGAICVPVCKPFTQPGSVKDCKYTGERTDGLIDEGGTYTCTCVDGYATDANGNTVTSTCTTSQWSTIDTCLPQVCQRAKPDNTKDCQYTAIGENGLINEGGSYECTCSIGHAPDTGSDTTITASCTGSKWSAGASCVPVCNEFAEPDNVEGCQYTGKRDDGLIDEGGTYKCDCIVGYTTNIGNTIESRCTNGEWSAVASCGPPVCDPFDEPTNVRNCQYTLQRTDNFVENQGTYTCKCVDGYASNSGDGITISSTCTMGQWSAINTCIRVCHRFIQPKNTINCGYSAERTDGLISEDVVYTCSCDAGYESDAGTGTTISSTCKTSDWSQINTCVKGLISQWWKSDRYM